MYAERIFLICTLVLIAYASPVPRQIQTTSPKPSLIRCDSFLTIIFPDQYPDCSCIYSEWSEWTPIPDSTLSVSSSQCPSGEAYQDIRQRTATIEGCPTPVENETRSLCLSDREDRLIMALGLGSSGGGNLQVKPLEIAHADTLGVGHGTENSAIIPVSSILGRRKRQACPNSIARPGGYICSSPPYTEGKRSVEESEEQQDSHSDHREEVVTLDVDPIPFKWSEHHKRFRRQNSCSGQNQYVLFLLDTSGSIGSENFMKMREAVATLSTLFCKPVQIAVMTFGNTFKLEFCFNCFVNDSFGSSDRSSRIARFNAVKNIPYRNGATNTGGAARCACDELLNTSCGLPSDASCIDVIFITDGYSNDPLLEICDEVKCIHDHMQYTTINTHSIGMANADQAEMQCIEQTDGVNGAFEYDNFVDFKESIEDIINKIRNNPDATCEDTTECLYGQWSAWILGLDSGNWSLLEVFPKLLEPSSPLLDLPVTVNQLLNTLRMKELHDTLESAVCFRKLLNNVDYILSEVRCALSLFLSNMIVTSLSSVASKFGRGKMAEDPPACV